MDKATMYYITTDTNTLYQINLIVYYDGKPDYHQRLFDSVVGMEDEELEDGKLVYRAIRPMNYSSPHYIGTSEWIDSEIEYIRECMDLANAGKDGVLVENVRELAHEEHAYKCYTENLSEDELEKIVDEEAPKYRLDIEVSKTPLSV